MEGERTTLESLSLSCCWDCRQGWWWRAKGLAVLDCKAQICHSSQEGLVKVASLRGSGAWLHCPPWGQHLGWSACCLGRWGYWVPKHCSEGLTRIPHFTFSTTLVGRTLIIPIV